MTPKYRLTKPATADLIEIREYIAVDNAQAADAVIRKIREAMRNLAANPGLGHRRRDLAPEDFRFWSVGRFMIIYRADSEPLTVVRVWHSARESPDL